MNPRIWLLCGALLGGTGVIAGAYGAHGLEARLTADLKADAAVSQNPALSLARLSETFAVAVRYQMIHAGALLAVGLLAIVMPSRWWTAAAVGFLFGVAIFSGCLYALVFTHVTILGAIVPFGGLAMILGWLALAIGAVRAPITSRVTNSTT